MILKVLKNSQNKKLNMVKAILKEIITDIIIFIITMLLVIFLNKMQMIGNSDLDEPIKFEQGYFLMGSSSFYKKL